MKVFICKFFYTLKPCLSGFDETRTVQDMQNSGKKIPQASLGTNNIIKP